MGLGYLITVAVVVVGKIVRKVTFLFLLLLLFFFYFFFFLFILLLAIIFIFILLLYCISGSSIISSRW